MATFCSQVTATREANSPILFGTAAEQESTPDSATKTQQKCRHFQHHGATPGSSPVTHHGSPSETCRYVDRKVPQHFTTGLTRKRGKMGAVKIFSCSPYLQGQWDTW